MTLLEQTYTQLREAGLVRNTASFSTEYAHRNRNWYAWQKNVGRDMCAAAAIQCLRTIRDQLKAATVTTTQRSTLEATASALLNYLLQRYAVADVN